MTNYIKFNKGNIDKLPNPDKRGARYYQGVVTCCNKIYLFEMYEIKHTFAIN
jgi:hypothetical protein